MKIRISIILLLFSLSLKAENNPADFKLLEDSLINIFQTIEGKESDDAAKLSSNDAFRILLKNTLLLPASYKYEFRELKSISILTASDRKFRIFSWGFATSDGVYHYYGFTQYNDKKNKKIILRELQDNNTPLNEYSKYSDSTWYGAVYYELVPRKKKSDSCYVLLGWDGNDWMSKKRIIEPVYFSRDGKINFGNPLFKEKEVALAKVKKTDKPVRTIKKESTGKEKQRIVFEYAAKAAMSLHYKRDMKMIVFDHLAPSDPMYTNMFMFYAPDFSYDAYYYKKKNWYLNKNVDVRNKKIIKAQPYQPANDEDIKLKKPLFK
ncbi:MAG: hypothetical protein ACKOXB_07460 [Flavobacteriales bacterium]